VVGFLVSGARNRAAAVYIAQRIFSARDERHGLLSVLWFNLAHYALRALAVDSDRPGGCDSLILD